VDSRGGSLDGLAEQAYHQDETWLIIHVLIGELVVHQEKNLALVMSGGGARGAFQAGALRALMESGIQPQFVVGTSAGAINASFLALRGWTPESIEDLARCWRDAQGADFLPSNALWVTVRAVLRRGPNTYTRIRDFFMAHGLKPEIRFSDLQKLRLFVVAADLRACRPVVYGIDPEDGVLDAVLASTALPPWVAPLDIKGQLLMDGGVVSVLPIECAVTQGATEIIALDLADQRETPGPLGWWPVVTKMWTTAGRRQTALELLLAEAKGIPVKRLLLQMESPVAIWDFSRIDEMISAGYEAAIRGMAEWPQEPAKPVGWAVRWKNRWREAFRSFKMKRTDKG
jgi:NTE family protein